MRTAAMAVTAATDSVDRAGFGRVAVSVAMGRDYASIEQTEAARMSETKSQANDSGAGERPVEERHILALRAGHGANCSSIGSVVDTLFASAVIGSMVFAAALAAMKSERVTIAGAPRGDKPGPTPRSDGGPRTTRSG